MTDTHLVDATYRSDLRELNELNFARFSAEVDAGFARVDAKLEQLEARLDVKLAQFETRLTKRMFAFWIGQSATTVALVLGVVKLWPH